MKHANAPRRGAGSLVHLASRKSRKKLFFAGGDAAGDAEACGRADAGSPGGEAASLSSPSEGRAAVG